MCDERMTRADSPSIALTTILMVMTLLAVLPDYSAAQQRTERVVVAPVDTANQPGVVTTRQQLDEQVRRFADRYIKRMSIAVDRMRKYPLTPAQFESVQNWETMSSTSAVDIAIGSNAVTNLFDMMTLTSYSRMVIEDYWVPERFGDEIGRPLLDASSALEKDIWNMADAVLSPELQAEMQAMIRSYRTEHPDQVNPWWIRMDEFSGQRAARLNAVRRSGGLLREVRRARETAEEFQESAERALFYLQRAPGIVFNTMETSALQLLGGPQVLQLLEDYSRFVETVDQLANLIETLPGERSAIVDQLMEGLDHQREAFFNDFPSASPEVRLMLDDLRVIVESAERITATLNSGDEPSEPVDIAEYRALTADVTQAAVELTKLVDAVGVVTEKPIDLVTAVDHVVAGQERVLNRLLVILLISIAFFFVCLSGYRFVAVKVRRG